MEGARALCAAPAVPRVLAALVVAVLFLLADLGGSAAAAHAAPRSPAAPSQACSCGAACRCARCTSCDRGGCRCTMQNSVPSQALTTSRFHEFLPPALPGLREAADREPSPCLFPTVHGLLPEAHQGRLLRPPRPLPVA